MARSLAVSLHALAAETATGTATGVNLQPTDDPSPLRQAAQIRLALTAISGTSATLTVTIETSADNVAWETVASFTARTTVGTEDLWFGPLKAYVRASWTLTATGAKSATFSVTGTAKELYCTPAELAQWGIPAAVLAQVTTSLQVGQLVSASSEAHSYLAARHTAPFTALGDDVRGAVAKIAAVGMLTSNIGIDPSPQATAFLIQEKDAKVSWLRQVAAGKAEADVTDSTPDTIEGTGAVSMASEPTRGWGVRGVV